MTDRRVALLRGINVGRAKRISMGDLRALFAGLGYGDVKTLLNSGNIVAKLLQYVAGARVFGQIMLGLSRPAAALSRGADVDEIVAVAALVGLLAVEYRKLYPPEVVEPDIT